MPGRWAGMRATLLVFGGAVWLLWPDHRPVPQTRFVLTDGRTLQTQDLLGKSVLVNFWSVNCTVCLRDMPKLTRLHESLQEEGFMVIGVALAQDPPDAVIDTVRRRQPGYPIALDVHGETGAAFGGIRVTPTSFLIAPDGTIRHTERGPLDETRIRATLLTF